MRVINTEVVRLGSGSYEVINKKRKVHVFKNTQCNWWMAAAEWDKKVVTKPLASYKEAKVKAVKMIQQAERRVH